jgi:catechol 2,3-dioxygenase-like lactoylglutathione lyase family enzyme
MDENLRAEEIDLSVLQPAGEVLTVPDEWLCELKPSRGGGDAGGGVRFKEAWDLDDRNGPPIHVAFRVPSRAAVDAFHRAAIAAGGRDNGAPGLRPNYHPNYYGAYVLDPDGHNIEAVCHEAQ